MRPLLAAVSLLTLIGPSPALADVVTLVGLDACDQSRARKAAA